MFSNTIEKLSGQLRDGLADIAAKKLPPEKHLSATLQLIRALLNSLRQELLLHSFPDKDAEIYFFKLIKPQFLAAKIYELECYNIEQSRPAGTREKQVEFYESELEVIRRFLTRHAFLYQYYRSGLNELDNLYFIRGAEVPSTLLPEFGEPDPEFSTCGDYLFGKFKACEQLQGYLLKHLERLDPTNTGISDPAKDMPELKWTGDKVNLVEVIYAFHFTGQLNNGNADIAQIIQFMEMHLHIDLSRAYRDFIDIRNRKVSSPTRYLDQMRESIHKRIDDDLALKKPAKARFE